MPVLATASDLLFQIGSDQGLFRALDATNGEILWSFRTGGRGNASPVTYQGPDGRQYVAYIASARRHRHRRHRRRADNANNYQRSGAARVFALPRGLVRRRGSALRASGGERTASPYNLSPYRSCRCWANLRHDRQTRPEPPPRPVRRTAALPSAVALARPSGRAVFLDRDLGAMVRAWRAATTDHLFGRVLERTPRAR
jgi:hypothetical protein